jgi:hypothetical protein
MNFLGIHTLQEADHSIWSYVMHPTLRPAINTHYRCQIYRRKKEKVGPADLGIVAFVVASMAIAAAFTSILLLMANH